MEEENNLKTNEDVVNINNSVLGQGGLEPSINSYTTDNNQVGREISMGENDGIKFESQPIMENPEILGEKKDKKGNKKLFIGLGIGLAAVVLIVIGLFAYIKISFTAEKFLDNTSKEVNGWVDDIFKNIKTLDVDPTKYDAASKGTLKISSTDDNLKDLNDLAIEFNGGVSYKNKLMNFDLTLLEKSNRVLNANAYLSGDALYIESKDIYSKALSYKMPINVFENNTEVMQELLNIDNLKSVIKRVVGYFTDSLKEADLTTKSNGLNVVYRYEINENNASKIEEKFNALIAKDEYMNKIKSLDESLNINGKFEVTPMVIEIKVNTISRSVEEFKITVDDETITAVKTGKDTYKMSDGENAIEFVFSKEKVAITLIEKDNKYGELILERSKNKVKLAFEVEEAKVNININSDGNDVTYDVSIDAANNKINANIKNTIDSKNLVIDQNILVSAETSEINLKVTADMNTKYAENSVAKKEFADSQDINSLNEAEMAEITTNLMNKLSNVAAFKSLLESLNSGDTGYDIEDGADVIQGPVNEL